MRIKSGGIKVFYFFQPSSNFIIDFGRLHRKHIPLKQQYNI